MLKNIVMLMSGTLGSQVIAVLLTPIITRLFGPVEFGLLGQFLAIMMVFGPVAALTFPSAIVLPKLEGEARAIAKLSLITSGLLSILVFILLSIFLSPIGTILKLEALGGYLMLIPVGMFFMACQQVCEQWLIRNKEFKLLSKVAIVQSFVLNGAKVGGGAVAPVGIVLVICTIIGYLLHSSLLYLFSKNKIVPTSKDTTGNIGLLFLARKYIDFPLFRAPQAFLNLSSQSIPILMLAGFFGPAAAGFYTLARTIVALPANLMGKAVGDVFYPRIAEASTNSEPILQLFTKATLALMVVGLPPYLIIFLYGEWLFSIIFGGEWIEAGFFAGWLSIWIYTMFITSVCTNTLAVINGQRFNLLFTIIKVIFRVLSIYACVYFSLGAGETVMIFSVVSAVINVIFMVIIFYMVKEYDRNKWNICAA